MTPPIVGSLIRASLVNTETNIVENIVMCRSLEDSVEEGYKLVPMEFITTSLSPEIQGLVDILASVEANLDLPEPQKIERPIKIKETKWTQEKGYHED